MPMITLESLQEAAKELEQEADALLAIWEKRDRSNRSCWRRKYLSKVGKLDSIRWAIDKKINSSD
tara:strand:- start:649 stop:843 length:195 start_codon:yes stop_codon:yes gene_type:complete